MLAQVLLCRRMLFLFLVVVFGLGALLTGISILYLEHTQNLTRLIIERHVHHHFPVANEHPNEPGSEESADSRNNSLSTSIFEDFVGDWNNQEHSEFQENSYKPMRRDSPALLKILEEGFLATAPSLSVPSVYYFLPHLLDTPWSLRPNYCLSQGRNGVSVVLGIPIHREETYMLIDTLKDLLKNMTPEEETDTVIVVFVAETNRRHVMQISGQILSDFPEQVKSGLLEVVSPSVDYYPKMNVSRPSLTWQNASDQQRKLIQTNLDICFLMMYAQSKGKFYVQLQNGIMSSKNFITIMKNYALQKSSENPFWLMLQFSRPVTLGTMFKSVDLPTLIQFFFLFYSDQSLEKLLHYFVYTKTCHSYANENCTSVTLQFCLQYTPALFHENKTYFGKLYFRNLIK